MLSLTSFQTKVTSSFHGTAIGGCEMILIYTTQRYEDPKCSLATQGGALRKYKYVTTTPKKTCLKDLSRATSRRSWTTER